MAFINKKEQVVDIQLTSFGKKQLSKYGFKPAFYAFFDDGVIYHIESEDQNSSEDRIKQDIVSDTQVEFTGVDTRFDLESKKISLNLRDAFLSFGEKQDPVDSAKALKYMLANQSLGKQETPAFKLSMHTGTDTKFTGQSSEFLTQSGMPLNIPQLFVEPTYTVVVDGSNTMTVSPESTLMTDEMMTQDLMAPKVEFLNNSKVTTTESKLMFSIEEENVDYSQDNFTVEFFEIIDGNNKEQLVPLDQIEQLLKYFEIKFDESVDEFESVRKPRIKSFFA